jgi:hypothetical protein
VPIQLEIDYERGLTERFPTLMDVVRHDVENCGKLKKTIAADMDMSPSEFSRILADNPADPRNFTLNMLPAFVRATGRKTTIYWLIEAFLEDPEKRKVRALETLSEMLPQIAALVKDARAEPQLRVAGKAA